MTMSMASLQRRVGRQRDHGDARDHDLVDALVAELDDRVDHLLLLGLEDALLAAALDDEAELLACSSALRVVVRAEQPGHARRDRGQEARRAGRTIGRRNVDRSRSGESANALGVREGQALGHELAEDDREQAQERA